MASPLGHIDYECASEPNEIMNILEWRTGYDLGGVSAADWSLEIQRETDFMADMNTEHFQLLLEIICKLPNLHPLRVRLHQEIEGILP